MHVAFVFAHQDDEVGAAPWIKEEVAAGNRVSCAYLTDGAAKVNADIRDAESRAVLHLLGVDENDIALLGLPDRISDGALAGSLSHAHGLLEDWFLHHASDVRRIYSLAWEGGHPDHDAAHVITLAAAMRRGISDAWQFSLYNGYRCPPHTFRVLKQLPSKSDVRTCRYSISEGLYTSLLCWKYKSQIRTWVGLFPELFYRRALLRREAVVRFEASRIWRRPHAGPLLYERLFGASYGAIEARIAAFWENTPGLATSAVAGQLSAPPPVK